MPNHLKRFTNHDNYNAHISTGAAVLPNVCVCDNESEIHYNELKLITFTINSVQYQAVDGMTWGEFINSKYNIDNNIYIIDNTIAYGNIYAPANINANINDVIISNKRYGGQHSG